MAATGLLVAGASGAAASRVMDAARADPSWRVTGLSRRRPDGTGDGIEADLTDPGGLCRARAAPLDITHQGCAHRSPGRAGSGDRPASQPAVSDTGRYRGGNAASRGGTMTTAARTPTGSAVSMDTSAPLAAEAGQWLSVAGRCGAGNAEPGEAFGSGWLSVRNPWASTSLCSQALPSALAGHRPGGRSPGRAVAQILPRVFSLIIRTRLMAGVPDPLSRRVARLGPRTTS